MQNQGMNKRLAVLVLSFATIICYGYAIGGIGAHFFGRSEPLVIVAGLAGGSFCLWLAFRLWRQFLDEAEKESKARLSFGGQDDSDDETEK